MLCYVLALTLSFGSVPNVGNMCAPVNNPNGFLVSTPEENLIVVKFHNPKVGGGERQPAAHIISVRLILRLETGPNVRRPILNLRLTAYSSPFFFFVCVFNQWVKTFGINRSVVFFAQPTLRLWSR